jgi:hypothetical protein
MPCPLTTDCLIEVFENLENDKPTLHSCLLVNRLWCNSSVKILWKDICSFKHNLKDSSAILSTLIACLPNESEELLHKNKIFILTPTSKSPLFNYVSFCKILSIGKIGRIIDEGIKSNTSLKDRKCLVIKELLITFMNQISSLKKLTYYDNYYITNEISFTFPRAKDCLADLSELRCSTIINFDQLSLICHNLQSLSIKFESEVSNSLIELVSSQNNLKNLELLSNYDYGSYSWKDIVPALAKHSNTLEKLKLHWDYNDTPLSFVSLFINLQEINFSFVGLQFEGFRELQYVTFPKLQILKFSFEHPKTEYLMKFLEINGKNLQKFYIRMYERNKDFNISIAKFCPNLKKLLIMH